MQEIVDSMQHPFYVIDINTHQIVVANKACGFGEIQKGMTCHMVTHNSPLPCVGEHICPLEEVKKTRQSCKTEHIHYGRNGQLRVMEVHGDPVFDEKGNLAMMIEYAFDITERKEAEKALESRLREIERINKVMMGREERVIELKKEVNDLLKAIGRDPKFF